MKTLYLAVASAATLLLSASCSETYDIYSEEYAKVVRIKEGGLQSVNVYSVQDETIYPITVMKGGYAPETTANAVLRVMSEEEFNDYLGESGAGYSYLSSDCYSFKGGTDNSISVNFEPKQGFEVVELVLNTSKVADFFDAYDDVTRDPVVPIVLEITEGSVDGNSYQLFVKPSYSEPSVGFINNDGVIKLSEGADVASLRLGLPMESPWDITCQVEVDPTVLEQYNNVNNETYGLMLDDAYKGLGDIVLNKGAEYAPLNIEFDPDKAGFRTALPIRITRLSLDGLVLANNTALIIYEGDFTKYKLNLTAEDAYSPDDANDECLNDAGVRGTDGNGVEGLFDGIYSWGEGFFHACYFKGHTFDPVYNSYIEFDLKAPRNMVVFEYTNRIYYTSTPKEIRIWALDGTEWKEIGHSNTEKIFVTTWGDMSIHKWPVGAYVAPFKFQKVRFSVVRGTGGVFSGTAERSNQFGTWACSEMGIYAK